MVCSTKLQSDIVNVYWVSLAAITVEGSLLFFDGISLSHYTHSLLEGQILLHLKFFGQCYITNSYHSVVADHLIFELFISAHLY